MLKRISLFAALAIFAVACNQSAEKDASASTETSESSKATCCAAIREFNKKERKDVIRIYNIIIQN